MTDGRLQGGASRLALPPAQIERVSLEELIERAKGSVGRGTAIVAGGSFDRRAIPTDPRQRILRVPIPQNADGKPCYPRDQLEPNYRANLKVAHDAKVLRTLEDRKEIVARCAHDLRFRAEVMEACSKDVVFWINHFGWTTDPRDPRAATDAMILYEGQEREARFWQDEYIQSPEDEIIWIDEKTRAYGWTWLHIALEPIWGWLFMPNYSVLLGGVNAKNVDDGGQAATALSHFGKIRFALSRLPAWMLPPGILLDKGRNKTNTLKHPTKPNIISGRQYCDNWARQDRFTDLVCDEAAWSLKFRAATLAFGNAAKRAHVGSTPKGLDNEYAAMRFGDEEKIVHTLWWGHNPYITVDHYWAWRKKHGPEKTAQERDIDYGRSSAQAIFQEFDPNVAVASLRAEVRDPESGEVLVEARAELEYDKGLPLYFTCDPGWDDEFAILWYQLTPRPKRLHIVDFIQYDQRTGPFFVPFLTGYIPSHTLDGDRWEDHYEYDDDERRIIALHAAWHPPVEGFGDRYGRDGNSKMASGRSLYDTWERYGTAQITDLKVDPNMKTESVQRLITWLPRIRIVPRLLHQRTQKKDNPTIVECFQQYSWVVRESPTGRELKQEPKHDKFCHAMDALAFPLKYEDPDDPSLDPLPPREFRRVGDDARRGPWRRSPHEPEPSGEYRVDSDPILEG